MKGYPSCLSSTTSSPLPAILPPLPVRRFTVDEYHQLIQTGVLGEDDDVELLEGWIVPKMARNPAHDAVVSIDPEPSSHAQASGGLVLPGSVGDHNNCQ